MRPVLYHRSDQIVQRHGERFTVRHRRDDRRDKNDGESHPAQNRLRLKTEIDYQDADADEDGVREIPEGPGVARTRVEFVVALAATLVQREPCLE